MNTPSPTLLGTVVRTIVTHTVTYFIMGLLASTLLNYAAFFASPGMNAMMRPLDDPWVMAGPVLQPIRGLVFGILFYLLREPFFQRRNGWLLLWLTLLIVGIIGPFGPTPGSLEGLIYTTFPLSTHVRGLPEVVLQSLLLSVLLFYWVRHPENRWLNWGMGIAFVVLSSLPILGLLMLASA